MKKKTGLVIFIIFMVIMCFLKTRECDEIYIDFNAIKVYAENKDTSQGVISIKAKDITGENGHFATSSSYDIPRGKYEIAVEYETDEDLIMVIKDGELDNSGYVLTADKQKEVIAFESYSEINDFKLEFYGKDSGSITLKNVDIRSDSLLYTDHIWFTLLLIAMAIFCLYYYRDKKPDPEVLICLVAVLVCSYPLFDTGLIRGHDTIFHMMRVEGIKDALRSGQFPAVIYPEDAYKHGYLGTLYPNLFLYIPALMRLAGISALNTYRASFVIVSICSFISAYYMGSVIVGNRKGAIISAVLFTLAPFRIIDMYYRSTLGETIALIFFPLVIAGLYNITVGNRNWLPLFIGMSGLIESHILSAIFGGIVCFAVCLVFIVKLFKEKRIIELIKAAVFSLVCNLGFFVPFFYYRAQDLQLDDTIRRFNPANEALPLADIFKSLPELLTDKDDSLLRNDMVPVLGIVGLACLILMVVYLIYSKEEKDRKVFAGTLFTVSILFIYVASTLFPWRTAEKIEPLFYQLVLLEHPWRLFGVVIVVGALGTALSLEKTSWFKMNQTVTGVGLLALLIIALVPQMDIYMNRPVNIKETTGNTAYSYNVDYMPHNFKNMDTLKEDVTYTADDGVQVDKYVKNGLSVSFEYKGAGSVRIPLLYYRGYYARNERGEALNIRESDIGTVEILLPAYSESGSVTVGFEQPLITYIALIISLIGVVIVSYISFSNRASAAGKQKKKAE
ncbi:MAG: hypothetical protein K6F99_10885 [Lachnospiraceae bacterium]|nr:hypothetical protein [Lachnospiraceae bacterium]